MENSGRDSTDPKPSAPILVGGTNVWIEGDEDLTVRNRQEPMELPTGTCEQVRDDQAVINVWIDGDEDLSVHPRSQP
jgi:hypothetical protein